MATVDLTQPFSLAASLSFGCKDANGADGIVFVFAATPGLGVGGGGMGYQGLGASIGIEMDDYQNGGFGDPGSDHMAIQSNGNMNHNLVGPTDIPNIEDCGYHCFSVNWNPATNTLSATLDGTTVTYVGDITAFCGSSAYYGFTSGTGSLSNPHLVCLGAPPLVPMNDVTICPGESTQLQADPTGSSWTWQSDPTLSATNISNPTATPTSTTTYNVTISYGCGYTNSDDVTVTLATPPNANASSNTPLCEGENLQLNASGGLSYDWSGPLGFFSSQQNPIVNNVTTLQSGTYTVTVTDADGCTASASTQVVINPNPIVSIVALNGPLCSNGDPVTMQAIPAGGTWGGAASSTGQVDPTMLVPGSHIVTYTYVDANGCSAQTDYSVEVVPAPLVQIFAAGPFCQTDPPVTLNADPSGGIWSGDADPFGNVIPANLSPGLHSVHYEYTDIFGCGGEDDLDFFVQPGTTVTIQPVGPFCADASIQTMTASPTGGAWGGAATSSGQINPATLGPGMHEVYYFLNIGGACPGADTFAVQILTPPTATISGSGTICDGTITTTGAGPLEVTYVVNNQSPTTITVPTGTTTVSATAAGTYTITDVVDAHGCHGTGSGSAQVTVVGSPTVSGLDFNCNGDNSAYTVTFTISGGDPATYSVTGAIPGTLTTSPPYVFTSNAIPTGNAYNWTVNDGNNCDPITLTGNHSCACTTEAGTMSSTPLQACVGSTVTAAHNGDEVLDANDNLIFVLHSSNGNSLGTIFDSNSTGIFGFVPPMVAGTTYYISAVAGDSTANDGVDLQDPCLSVSFGQPVVFTALPTITLANDQEICTGESATLSFTLTGNGPFDVVYSNGSQNFPLNNILNGHTITVTPTATTTYSIVSVGDNSNPACTSNLGNSVTVTVWPKVNTTQTISICEGESVVLGGAPQTTPGTYTDSLSTVHGCDSIIVSTLIVNQLNTTYLSDASCNPADVGTFIQNLTNQNGCDSTVITTVVFSLTDTTYATGTTCNPAMAGVFTQNFVTPQGCDSTVITTVALLPSDTTQLFDTSCNPANLGSFITVLSNQYGCDSVIILTVSFSQSDTTLLTSTTCNPAAAGVFTQNLVTPEGCDSVVISTVALLASDSTFLTDTSCDPNNVGSFIQNLTNQNGCDSTVVLTVTYSASDTTLLNLSTCNPAAAGVFTQNLITADGCDSLVITTVALLASDSVILTSTSCNPSSVGTFVQNLTNQNGCDSTVVTTVTLLPSDTTILTASSCNPQDTGVVIQILSNQFGCDSTVIITTTLVPPAQCGVEFTLTGSTVPCGQTVGPLTLTVTLGEGPFNYAWSGPQSGSGTAGQVNLPQIIGNLPPGNYSVTVTAANGLTASATATIGQNFPPTLSAQVVSDYNGEAISCFGEADGSAAATPAGGTPPFNFIWSNGQATATATDLGIGNYSVTVTDANGCTASSSVIIGEPTELSLTFSVNDLNCFGQSNGAVTAVASGGTPPYTYTLDNGTPQNSATFLGLAAGTFELTVTDANGCSAAGFIGVNAPVPVDVNLGDDQHISLGDETSLDALVNLPFDQVAEIVWQGLDSVECGDCLEQPVVPLFTTTYSVAVTAENGCTDSDQVTVFVDRRRSVYIPNAFSPNEDGLNDVFMIFAKPGTVKKVKSFLVFSRWGESIFQYFNFEPNNPIYGWDGKHRDAELNPSVFVWFAEIEFSDGVVELFEGDVSLIR